MLHNPSTQVQSISNRELGEPGRSDRLQLWLGESEDSKQRGMVRKLPVSKYWSDSFTTITRLNVTLRAVGFPGQHKYRLGAYAVRSGAVVGREVCSAYRERPVDGRPPAVVPTSRRRECSLIQDLRRAQSMSMDTTRVLYAAPVRPLLGTHLQDARETPPPLPSHVCPGILLSGSGGSLRVLGRPSHATSAPHDS